jgi:hypothetical protein
MLLGNGLHCNPADCLLGSVRALPDPAARAIEPSVLHGEYPKNHFNWDFLSEHADLRSACSYFLSSRSSKYTREQPRSLINLILFRFGGYITGV